MKRKKRKMKKNEEKNTDIKRITLDIPKELYKKLHLVIVSKYDSTYGHIREAFIEGVKMWINQQKIIV